jgi:hypothetical protein
MTQEVNMIRWLLFTAVGCASAEVAVTPESLDFGAVDFNLPMPVDGYNAIDVRVENVGSKPVDLRLRGVDEDRLLVSARFEDPPRLPILQADQHLVLTVGVIGYTPGELTSVVEGSFRLASDQLRDPIVIGFSYAPERN